MKYAFHPDVMAEFHQAIDYYEGCETGLGYDFAIEVHSAIDRAIAYPKAWPAIEGSVRRSLVRRFPYGVMYAKDGHRLYVLAVMNLHRKPDYWKSRY